MKTVTALQSFTAYPDGRRRRFLVGQEFDVDAGLAKAWSASGLVTIAPAAKPTKPSQKATEPSPE